MRTGRPHAGRTVNTGPWTSHIPVHEASGFHVVRSGSCEFGRTNGDRVTLHPGDVVFVPHGASHHLSGAASTQLICGAYFLDRTRPHPLLAELPDFVHVTARGTFKAAVDLLDAELEHPGRGAEAATRALVDMLLLHMLRTWFDDHPECAWALHDKAITKALHAIHHEPHRPWTVESLGDEAGLSRAAFAKQFATLVGQPPLAYLTWWRMTTAARLLKETDAPLGALAARTGYTSEFAFAKAFKREHGVAPGEYRRHYSRSDSLRSIAL
ncbi:AraC family transcriptional regulator [Actinosynnema sp. CS-041913]|uniref:AraC family transcriptional regulator n=1 Tax=Actinosynnema sp. CS-041913 TaxID=3239917 RepID=UPI003D8D818C